MMRYVAYLLIAMSLLGAAFCASRAMKAGNSRDEQEADANDIVIAIAMVGWCVCLGLAAVVFAALG